MPLLWKGEKTMEGLRLENPPEKALCEDSSASSQHSISQELCFKMLKI